MTADVEDVVAGGSVESIQRTSGGSERPRWRCGPGGWKGGRVTLDRGDRTVKKVEERPQKKSAIDWRGRNRAAAEKASGAAMAATAGAIGKEVDATTEEGLVVKATDLAVKGGAAAWGAVLVAERLKQRRKGEMAAATRHGALQQWQRSFHCYAHWWDRGRLARPAMGAASDEQRSSRGGRGALGREGQRLPRRLKTAAEEKPTTKKGQGLAVEGVTGRRQQPTVKDGRGATTATGKATSGGRRQEQVRQRRLATAWLRQRWLRGKQW
ncbi:hypothetical protein BHE74_00017242 [Ensete ventricosum]|nr:hypothetical protein BHE74_00017242 [Ensete ventricosum]